ncbi:MAG: hypothetical protein LBL79_14135 [Prevotella sp.]|nr:hypothetical protein [Prevotella sp.]
MKTILYRFYQLMFGKRKILFLVLLSLSFVSGLRAQQSPGGVSNGLRLWLRSDALSGKIDSSKPNNGASVTSWKDFSQKSNVTYGLPPTGGTSGNSDIYFRPPTYKSYDRDMNFLPTVHFERIEGSSGYRQYLSATSGVMVNKSPDTYTIFTVANIKFDLVANTGSARNPETIAYFMGFGGNFINGSNSNGNVGSTSRRAPAVGLTGGRGSNNSSSFGKGRFYSYDSGNAYDGQKDLFTPRSTLVAVHEVTKSQYIQYEADGRKERMDRSSGLSAAQVRAISSDGGITMNGASMLGAGSRPARNMIGYISEVIVYERVLSENEKQEVYSYLGLKYGITISPDGNRFDYKFSDGTILWPGKTTASYGKYHHNVAAIVRDDTQRLWNDKARSTDESSFVTIELPGAPDINGTKSMLARDKTAIVWGDDNASLTKRVVPIARCAPYAYDIARLWMIDSHMIAGSKELTLKTSGFADMYPFNGAGWDVYLMIAKNETDAKNGKWDRTIPSTYINGEQVFKFLLDDNYPLAYFSFGASPNAVVCATCTFSGEEKLLIQQNNTSWGSRVKLNGGQSITKTNVKTVKGNFSMDVKFEAAAGTTLSVDAPAVHNANSPVHLKASGTANGKSTITYTFRQPADVEFVIGDIDQMEVVEVYGYCGNDQIRPSRVEKLPLSGRKGHTFDIQNVSKMVGNGKQSPGRGNPQGKVSIQFGVPVGKVVIEYTNTKGALRWLDLYPLTFSCPQQLPPPNEAGYAFAKRGPANVDICETVDYSFTIMNANPGCDPEPVRFKDELPQGMYWVPNSLVVNAGQLDANYTLTMSGRTLDLNGLLLPGSGRETHVRAQAAFTDDAATNTYYYNQGEITYTRKDNKKSETLASTDAYYISGNDKRTKTMVTGTKTYKSITTDMELIPSSCFKEDREAQVKVKVHNPNGQILSDSKKTLYFESYFNDNFSYKAGSLKINGAPVSDTASGVTIGTGDDRGIIALEGVSAFILPAAGDMEISYIITIPPKANLTFDNTSGKIIYDNMVVGHALSAITSDICLQNAFLNALDEYTVTYCSSPESIISNKMVQPRLK